MGLYTEFQGISPSFYRSIKPRVTWKYCPLLRWYYFKSKWCIASNPLELKIRNGLKLQKNVKKCLKPGFKNLTIAANFARAYIAELSPRALSYRFSFYIGRIYSVWFGRCGQTNDKLEIIVVDAPRKMIDILKSFWKIHGLLLLCVVRDSKRSFDYKGAQWRGKNEAKD